MISIQNKANVGVGGIRPTLVHKQKRLKPKGIIYIQSTENNTIITLTDLKGNAKSWASGGSCGFSGSRRSSRRFLLWA